MDQELKNSHQTAFPPAHWPPREILVPLDGSRFSSRALPYAGTIAALTGAKVRLLLVHEPFIIAGADSVMIPSSLDASMRERERIYLERAAAGLRDEFQVQAGWELLDGAVFETLLGQARKPETDLVVMTTHGEGGLKRLWLGSVADLLVRRATAPLLLVRGTKELRRNGKSRPLRQILVPLDGSEGSLASLPIVEGLAGSIGCHVTLLHAAQESSALPPENATGRPLPDNDLARLIASNKERVLRELEEIAHRLGKKGIRARVRVVDARKAAEEVLLQAQSLRADLIVMATHGRGGLSRIYLGSVADKVLRGAHVPVLLVRFRAKDTHPGASARNLMISLAARVAPPAGA